MTKLSSLWFIVWFKVSYCCCCCLWWWWFFLVWFWFLCGYIISLKKQPKYNFFLLLLSTIINVDVDDAACCFSQIDHGTASFFMKEKHMQKKCHIFHKFWAELLFDSHFLFVSCILLLFFWFVVSKAVESEKKRVHWKKIPPEKEGKICTVTVKLFWNIVKKKCVVYIDFFFSVHHYFIYRFKLNKPRSMWLP